ncbi:MAG: AraC family transcriptional regulator [Mediterranea sp.]|jgi:AraC-like DNA-binding protein|nr:AraC family transcriptional regulator [Mediterranea sp.]
MKEIQKEITPLSDNDLFIVLNHPSAKFDYPVHHHSDYEINLVMNTYGKRIVGDSEEDFSGLDLVMIGPDIPHAWHGEVVEGNHVVTIQFSDKVLGFPILQKRLFQQIKTLLYDAQRGICFSEKTKADMRDKILALTRMQGFQTVLEFFSILHELSIADRSVLMDNNYDTQHVVRTSKSRRIAKVCDYIERNYESPIKLGDVAAMVNMSESAFSHFFKKKTRYTFIDYIINLRIAKACQMLAETTHSIAEICFQCGFNNLSNFIRIFKKKKGSTPSEYRTMIDQMLIKY